MVGIKPETFARLLETWQKMLNEHGEEEPKKKTGGYQGRTNAKGRAKLYQKLVKEDKVALEKRSGLGRGGQAESGYRPPRWWG
jgi:hypothetical protein